ncbi:MAG: cytidylate kinase-like family protein [Anaerolineaceae bacterium]|jgi:cytidylate kinase|nr:cytidylate kinase-like family protein [Anaerolineaceae bacterium]
MPTITISRELGSQGRQIAENTAQALGYHFMDKRAIGEVMKEYGLVEFHDEYEIAPSFWDIFDAHRMERRADMINMLNKVILALAQHGNMVILGRAGFAVLRDYADVLNVRIQAQQEQRIAFVMADENITGLEQAKTYIRDNDQNRTSFIESFYGVKWDQASAFDLVINTSKISPEMVTNFLIAAARKLEKKQKPSVRVAASIPVDPVVYSSICKALKCSASHEK